MGQFGLLAMPVLMVTQLLSGSSTPMESVPVWLQYLMQTISPTPHFVAFAQAVLFSGADLSIERPSEASGQPETAQAFALPPEIVDRGVRRYGFHGLSYEYVASVLPTIDRRAAAGRAVVLHLGNRASMCAIYRGNSVASTMGFTALDGAADGDSLRQPGSRRGAVSHGRTQAGRPRHRKIALPAVRPARCVGHVERYARAPGL
jgi:hypothetical protein